MPSWDVITILVGALQSLVIFMLWGNARKMTELTGNFKLLNDTVLGKYCTQEELRRAEARLVEVTKDLRSALDKLRSDVDRGLNQRGSYTTP